MNLRIFLKNGIPHGTINSEKLKEFLADVKAYRGKTAHNSFGEANALKTQLDGALHYMENIAKMFDDGAVATEIEAKTETEVTNCADRRAKKGTEDADTGRNSNDEGTSEGTSEKDRDRSRVPKKLGEAKSELPQSRSDERQHRNEINLDKSAEVDLYTLTDEETGAILAYKSGGSYLLNAKLREA